MAARPRPAARDPRSPSARDGLGPGPARRGPPRTRCRARIGPATSLLLAAAALAAAACHAPLPGPERAWREQRERDVRAALPVAAQARFRGLRFFPWDPEMRFDAALEPVVPPEPLEIAASDGRQRPAHRVGRLRLRLPGGVAVLAVYQLDDMRQSYPDNLFLPFRDAGAGSVTYGAGRYVDVERIAGGLVRVDFNRAYNPDCAYGIAGQCPITPAENTLAFAVRAGEAMPPGHG
ncbi:MAG TPA: DUF1684 domain-containing protein [Thermoanaerobaculaceae bacterium]|nr:DUF1684 domain-containing protein [Thermoanaerobaculaceae bacterium]